MKSFNKEFDIAVFGGGPAGVACAYSAAKFGLGVLLVEKNNYLGGQMTGGLVVPMMKSAGEINTDFFQDLVRYAKSYGAQATYSDGNEGWFNPVVLKIVLEKMLVDAGVDILYEANLSKFGVTENSSGKKVDFVKVDAAFNSKILSIDIYSKYFVDATGDSKLCEFLNCDFIDDNSKIQPASLRFIVSNVNLEKFAEQILKLDNDRNVTSASKINGEVHLSTAYTFDTNKTWGLSKVFNEALKAGDLETADTAYFQVFTVPGMPGAVAFNCPRLQNPREDDVLSCSKSLIKGREAIYRLFNFMKKYFLGFENSYISQIADITGVRVSKRPKTKYIYKLDDILSSKTFKNPVLAADYPVDIHSNDKNASTLKVVKKYYLPIESLIVDGFSNLFTAGRNLGAEFEAQAALRIQKSCMSMGEGISKHISKSIKANVKHL